MWGGEKKPNMAKINTLIGQGTKIAGDVSFNGGLHVEGEIKGNVMADGQGQNVLILSEKGIIEGDVRVPNLVLNGQVQGNVYVAQQLDLLAHTRINGNVYYNLLEMASGAEVNGNLVHCKDETESAEYREAEVEEMPMAMVEEISQAGDNS